MRRAATVVLVLVLLAGASARAEKAPRAAVLDDLAATIDAHHAGAAYQQVIDLQKKFPHNERLRHMAGLCAFRLSMRDEALAQLDAGIAEHPKEARLWSLRALVHFDAGDIDGARGDLARATALDPKDPDAATTATELDTYDRASAREMAADSTLPVDSPGGLVDRLLALLDRGASMDELVRFVDPAVMVDLDELERVPSRLGDWLRAFANGFKIGAAKDKTAYHGWVIDGTEQEGDDVWVNVSMPIDVTPTQKEIDDIATKWADPATRDSVDPDMQTTLSEVDDDARPALLARMVGKRSTTIVSLRVELEPHEGSYWVKDAQYAGSDVLAQLEAAAGTDALSKLDKNLDRLGKELDDDDDDHDKITGFAPWLPYGVGGVVVGAALIGILIAVRSRGR